MDKFDSFKIIDLGKTDNFVSATGMANNGIDVLLESTSSLGHYVIENLSANGTLNSTTNLNTLLAATAHPLPGPSNNVNILGLKNGDVVVEYNNDNSNQTSFSMNAYFVVLDASGNLVTGPTQINTLTGPTQTRFMSMAELSNGNIVFGYQRSDNSTLATRVFAPNGTAVSSETKISDAVNADAIQVAASSNGSYMVAYNPSNPANDSKILKYAVYNNSGTLQTSGQAFSDPSATNSPVPSLIALSNGNYLYENSTNSATATISAKIYDASGNFVNGPVSIPSDAFGPGKIAALYDAGSGGFDAVVADPNYTAAFNAGANFNAPDNLYIDNYTNAGGLSSGPTQIDTGQARGVWNAAYSYYSTDIAPSYFLYSGLNGGLIEIKQAPNQTDGTTWTIGANLFNWAGAAVSPPTNLTLDSASDSGVTGDSITNVTTPKINGTGTAGIPLRFTMAQRSLVLQRLLRVAPGQSPPPLLAAARIPSPPPRPTSTTVYRRLRARSR